MDNRASNYFAVKQKFSDLRSAIDIVIFIVGSERILSKPRTVCVVLKTLVLELRSRDFHFIALAMK